MYMSKSTKVSDYGFTPFANVSCQSLLQVTIKDLQPLLMVDVKVFYSQSVSVYTLF